MGIIKGKFIKGKVGSVVYREYRDLQVIQGLPDIIKSHRTEGTKNAATFFGKASKLAGGIRRGLAHISYKFYDGTMIYRFNAEVLRCISTAKSTEKNFFSFNKDTFRSLAGFEFNVGSMVKNNFYVQPTVKIAGDKLQVIIPDINIPSALKWPVDRPKTCKLLIVCAMVDLQNGRCNNASPQVMDIPYTYTPSIVIGQTFEFEVIPGCLCVTGISLQYIQETFIGDTTVNTKSFNPSAILDAQVADGIIDPLVSRGWFQFDDKGYKSL